MPYINLKDDKKSKLYYEDYSYGDPIILIHGWPLTHKAWEPQVEALVEAGYRVISYDRKGFGQSCKPWEGYDYDSLASDLKCLIDKLELKNVTLAGFSMGGGEVARYIGKYGTDNISKAVLISAVTPFMLNTDDNPEGLDKEVFDDMKDGVRNDRFEFISNWQKDFMSYKDNKDKVSEEFLDFLFHQTLFATPKAMIDCIESFATTDFREDLKKFDIPTLVIHGGSDQICPSEICGKRVSEFAPQVDLKIIDDAPHGLNITHTKIVNKELVNFLNNNKAYKKVA